jgi:hypothetical protein
MYKKRHMSGSASEPSRTILRHGSTYHVGGVHLGPQLVEEHQRVREELREHVAFLQEQREALERRKICFWRVHVEQSQPSQQHIRQVDRHCGQRIIAAQRIYANAGGWQQRGMER